MTNGEKYKTAKERAEAFAVYAKPLAPRNEYEFGVCAFEWLDLEAVAKEILPCPFCGDKCSVRTSEDLRTDETIYYVSCHKCNYESIAKDNMAAVVVEHNRVARAAKEANND